MAERVPIQRILNTSLTGEAGVEVVMLEVLPIAPTEQVRVQFESSKPPWRQGIWLATQGILAVDGVSSSQLVLWIDTAPEIVEIDIVATDGLLRFYNIWDSGRGLGDHESQSATSGMLAEEIGPSTVRYRCNDIGNVPGFDKLIFTVTIE